MCCPLSCDLYVTHSTHVDWMRAYTGAIKELEEYVKNYQTTGLVWNPDVGFLPSLPSLSPSLSLSLCLSHSLSVSLSLSLSLSFSFSLCFSLSLSLSLSLSALYESTV